MFQVKMFKMEINEEVIKCWVTKLEEWKEVDTIGILEMTEGMAELMNLLSELEKTLTDLEPRQILSQFPSVPKLLNVLLNNVVTLTTESLYRLVMKCVTAVAVSGGGSSQDGITNKSVKWVKSQMKSVCTSTPPVVQSLVGVAESLDLQPLELTEKLNDELVMSLVKDLSDLSSREWNNSAGEFFPKFPIQGTTLRSISEMCLPIISKRVAQPLIEGLLTCHVASDVMRKSNLDSTSAVQVEEALSPHFLDAIKIAPKEWYLGVAKGTSLSYEARLGLWQRDFTYFEDEVFALVEICCKERIFISRNEMRKVVSLRDLPKALSDNISLFSIAFGILQRVIHETKGNYHVVKFLRTLLDCVNICQRQNKLHDPFYDYNYANVWSAQFSDLVNALTIDWNEIPADPFIHHIKTVELCINEIHQSRTEDTVSNASYYVWLILQGFPKLVQKCYWIVLVGTEEFIDVCLSIQLYYHAGGTKLSENDKHKVKDFICTLRLLKNKSLVTTSDILCAVDSFFQIDTLQKEINIRSLIKNLVVVFILITSSTQNFNLQDIFSKLTEQLPAPHALDFLLSCLEEAFETLNKSELLQWPYEKNYFKTTSSFMKLLHDMYAKFKEYINHPTNLTSEVTICNTADLTQRFQTVCQLLEKGIE